MGEGRPIWVGLLCVVIVSSGFVAACSPVPGEPAPVYMMGGTGAHERMASTGIQRAPAPAALVLLPQPPTSVRRTAPDVIPLDGQPRARLARPVAARVPSAIPSATPPPVSARTAPETAKADLASGALPHGAHFSWPLNGRILTGYGAATDGGHNDGINI